MTTEKKNTPENKKTAHAEEPKSNKTGLLLGLLGLLLLASLVGNFMLYNSNNTIKEEKISAQTELSDTYIKLNDIGQELDLKIAEINKLGGDIEELNRVREEIETEKEELRKGKAYSDRRYKEIKGKVEAYEVLLKKQDEEIAKLQEMNEVLLTENTELKTEQNVLTDSIGRLAQTTQKLSQKVETASRLKAENIKVFAVNKRGKEREGEFKSRQIDNLKVEFNIGENNVAGIEGKDILIRVIEPEGNVLFDVATGSGTFMFNGKEEFYTAKKGNLV